MQQVTKKNGTAGNGISLPHDALTHRMTNSQRLAKVRSRLLRWISNHSHPASSAPANDLESEAVILRETILIRNEFYCGRRFFTPNHHAIWFIEEDELKIYHENGELLCVLNGQAIDEVATDNGQQASEADSHEAAEILRMPAAHDPATSDSQGESEQQQSTRRAA